MIGRTAPCIGARRRRAGWGGGRQKPPARQAAGRRAAAVAAAAALAALALAAASPSLPSALADSHGAPEVDLAAPQLIAEGFLTGVGGLRDIDAFTMNGSEYAVGVSLDRHTAYLIRIHDNGTLSLVTSVTDGSVFDRLRGAFGVDVFAMNGTMHALVAAYYDNGVQLIRIHENGTMKAADSMTTNGTKPALNGASRVASFSMNGTVYAIVTGSPHNAANLIKIHANGTLEWKDTITDADGDDRVLWGAFGVDVFDLDDGPRTLIAAISEDGFELIRIYANNESLAETGHRLESPVINLGPYDSAFGVAAFEMNGTAHALLTAHRGHYNVHLVRIQGDGSLEVLDRVAGIGAASDADVFQTATGAWYGLVASDGGAHMIRVHDNGTLAPTGVAVNGMAGFERISGAYAPSIFSMGGRTFAIVASQSSDAQLIRLSPAAVANVTASAANGTYGPGSAFNISVAFDGNVTVTEPTELRLNTGRSAGYASGNGTGTLVFRYEVADGDRSVARLEYDGVGALRAGPGGPITEWSNGNAYNASTLLPRPGSAGSIGGAKSIAIDSTPRVASVTSPDANATYGTGAAINITVRLSEPVSFDPPDTRPEMELGTGNENDEHRHAVCAPGDSPSPELACTYTVRRGDATADLGYGANSSLILAGATASDAAGNGLDPRLPDAPADSLAGSKDIALDTEIPEVLRVTSPDANATYGRGDEIRIQVVFNGTVDIDPEPSAGEESVPALHLETGENNRAALYADGSGTSTLEFNYTVIAGDFSADLNYAETGALSLGHRALVDEYGNRERSPALPGPSAAGSLGSQKDIAVRTVPTVEGVGANYTAGASLKVGQTVGVRVQFSEKVNVAPAANGSLPHIELDTGRAGGAARAAYSTGAGGHALVFAYPVHHLDSKDALDYAGAGALRPNGARIYGAGADADLALPDPASGGSLAAAGIDLRPNEAPSITQPANRTHGAGIELREGITATDPERQPLAFSLVEPVPAGASIDAATGLFAWTPTEAQRTAGGADRATYVITVRATDPYTASDTARFAVTVIEAPPAGYTGPTIAAIPDAEGPVGEEIRLDIAVAAGGHGPFVYSLVVDADPPPPRGAIVHPNGTFSWTPGYGQNGTHQITAKAADRFGLAGTSSFTVSVLDAEPPWNAPPAIEAIDPISADEGERLVVRVSATDPDLPIAYSLAGDPPARASIDSATGVFVWDIWYDQAGTHSIAVSAADRYGRASSASFDVAVADVEPPDLPPSIDPVPPQRVTAGTALSLQVNASDPNEGDTVTFDLAGPPPGAVITVGGLFTWTPGRGHIGENTLNVTATDDRGLSSWAPLVVTVEHPAVAADASAKAVFTGPRTVRIDYTAPLGPPAGHAGPVYGGVSIEGGGAATPASVSGLGTSAHIVRLEGDAAGRDQNGTIALLAGLEGAHGGALHTFASGSIPVGAGEEARTLSPHGAPAAPVAAIEHDGFVRAINATDAGAGARPAINVSGLAGGAGAAPGAGPAATTATMPGEHVSIITSFAVVTIPPSAVASSVPSGGLLEMYVSERPPTAQEIADALGRDSADGIVVLTVAEVGGNAARIEFSLPVRVLLVGHADGSAFYVNSTGGVVPIRDLCGPEDDAASVHQRLGGSGECWLNSGDDKVVYTYHLTQFGAADVPPSTCGAVLARQSVDLEAVGAGGVSKPVSQVVWRAYDSLPLTEVSIRAGNWTLADGSGGFVMQANATQVRTGAASAAGGAWAPMNGEVGAPLEGGGWFAPVEFRVAAPAGTLQGAAADVPVRQAVTYTVACGSPSG